MAYTDKVTCNLLNISSQRGTSFSRERYQTRFWQILLFSWCKLNHFSVNWVYMYTYFLTQTKTFVVGGVVLDEKKNKKRQKKSTYTVLKLLFFGTIFCFTLSPTESNFLYKYRLRTKDWENGKSKMELKKQDFVTKSKHKKQTLPLINTKVN